MSREGVSHVRHIDKTREYYHAEGYGKPLSQCRVGPATTGELEHRGAEPGPSSYGQETDSGSA